MKIEVTKVENQNHEYKSGREGRRGRGPGGVRREESDERDGVALAI